MTLAKNNITWFQMKLSERVNQQITEIKNNQINKISKSAIVYELLEAALNKDFDKITKLVSRDEQ